MLRIYLGVLYFLNAIRFHGTYAHTISFRLVRILQPSLHNGSETHKCAVSLRADFLHRTSPESHNKCGQYDQKFMYRPTMPIFTGHIYRTALRGDLVHRISQVSKQKWKVWDRSSFTPIFEKLTFIQQRFFVNKYLTEIHENPANG